MFKLPATKKLTKDMAADTYAAVAIYIHSSMDDWNDNGGT